MISKISRCDSKGFSAGTHCSGRGLSIAVFLTLFLSVLTSLANAQQSNLAVFPVEDLSKGMNSTNLDITRHLAAEIADRGFNVVPENDVISFMVAERIRWVGYLDTERLLEAKKNLGVDYILFGTIIQRDAKKSPTFGLSLNLVRTRDGKTIWTNTGGLSLADMQHILGINQPASLDELWPKLITKVLADLPENLDTIVNQSLIFDNEAGELPPTLQIKKLNLAPRYVRPGEQVKCIVELIKTEEPLSDPQIFIKVGNRIHLAQQSTEGLFYEASWTGSEIEKGIFREVGHESLHLAAADLNPQFFEGVWVGSVEDNVYPVSLILRWPDGSQQLAFVGNYTVDSSPPDMDLLIKGQRLNGLITFKDKIFILPRMKNREPFSQWKVRVEDQSGAVVMGDEGSGNLPRKLFWTGQGFNGFPVREGIYNIVVKGWDRAGNVIEISDEVAYRPNPPDIILDVERVNNALLLTIDSEAKEIPLSYWLLEVWNDTGELLKHVDGKDLPANLTIPYETASQESVKIEGRVVMQDILGNKTHVNIEDLYLLALRKYDSENQNTSEAPEEEDDSWAWLSEN